jgi:uncharacterized protein YkwD
VGGMARWGATRLAAEGLALLAAAILFPSRVGPAAPSVSLEARYASRAKICRDLHRRSLAAVLEGRLRAVRASDSRLEEAALARLNAARAAYAMGPLTPSATLILSARVHAHDLASRRYRAHASPEGCDLFARAIDFLGYPSGGFAENLAQGQADPENLVAEWLASEGHRSNAFHPEYVETGLALARSADGTPYWVQVFGDGATGPRAQKGRLACPDGSAAVRLPGNRGEVCATATHILGPFPRAYVARCKAHEASAKGIPSARLVGPDACDAPAWQRSRFLELRGPGSCPVGAKRDGLTGYCVERALAFGPFPLALRAVCQALEEPACATDAWPLRTLQRSWRAGGWAAPSSSE